MRGFRGWGSAVAVDAAKAWKPVIVCRRSRRHVKWPGVSSAELITVVLQLQGSTDCHGVAIAGRASDRDTGKHGHGRTDE